MGCWQGTVPAPLEPNALGLGSLSSVLNPKLPDLIPEILLSPEVGKKKKKREQGCPLALRDVPWMARVSLWSREWLREQAGKGLGRTGPVPAVAAAR